MTARAAAIGCICTAADLVHRQKRTTRKEFAGGDEAAVVGVTGLPDEVVAGDVEGMTGLGVDP